MLTSLSRSGPGGALLDALVLVIRDIAGYDQVRGNY
jgi:hypothetical protein